MPSDCVTEEARKQWMGDNVYDKIAKHDQELNKQEVQTFLNDYLDTGENDEGDHYYVEKLVPGTVFNKLFQMLDASSNGRVDRKAMLEFFYKLVENEASGDNGGNETSEYTKTSINEGGEIMRTSKVNGIYDSLLP